MKQLPFKKGMPVVWLTSQYHDIRLQSGEVTVVTTRDGATVVHVRAPDRWGGYWKRSFSPVAGMFQANPYPIWELQPLNGHNEKNLVKRAEKATKLYRQYEEIHKQTSLDVEKEARDWQYAEINRRMAKVPHGGKFLSNVVARMGFKKPKNGVKVKIHGRISTVR